ncbi:MAG: DUF3326 domain-containing protein [Spirulina sp. SIO3F2]|nr:DUF3326 domain-containing protein [Spirulina sp. SIO3F2]
MLPAVTARPLTAVLIIPTGIGANIGGYAGDALPVARALAQVCDRLITHPNVLNGAQLYWPLPNVSYVEGYGLDQFATGHWGLQPVHQNRIGVVLDAAIEPELRDRHLQALDAARATLGLNIAAITTTDQPLGVELQTAASGASWGTIAQPASLLRAGEILLDRAQAEAIAVVARFPDDMDEQALADYRHGSGVDALAGAEAVISHLIVRQFKIPCAHAPALAPLPVDPAVAPRSAAEELGYTFLPCVLAGLSRAPQFVNQRSSQSEQCWAEQVDALIVPAEACGGSATLSLGERLVIAVEDNQTTLAVPPEPLGIPACRVRSYWEAIGVLAAYRAGLDPMMLRPAIAPLTHL